MRQITRITSWTLRTLALCAVVASIAHAQFIDCSAPFVCTDGGLSGPTVLTESGGVNPITSPDIPAGVIDNMNKFGSGILSGSGGSPKLGTFEGTATPSRCVRTNANGHMEVATGDCAVATYAPVPTTSATLLSAGSTTVYIALSGAVATSATSLVGQSPCGAGTWRNMRIILGQNCTSCTVTFQTGTCGSSLSPSSLTVTPTTANTMVSDTSNTATSTATQCCQYKVAKTSAPADFIFTAVAEKSSN